jgi:1,2-diacylglycerol 3-alpha-glucosyltransferase
MRIGIFSDRYLPQTDGISFSIEHFRVELEKLGHEVYIFAPSPSWRYKERSKHIIRFAAVKGLFFDDWLTSVFFPPQALKEIEKLNLDIIHYQTPSQIGLLGAYYAIRNHIPLVTTYHTDLFEYVKHYPQVLPGSIALSLMAPIITGGGMGEYRQALASVTPERSVDKWNQKIVVHGLTLLHNHCDLVITPSRKIEKQLRSWKTTSRIEILPTGVDKITTTKREITLTRKKYGLKPSDKVILLVCRIGTEKNIDLLIKSFEIVANQLPEAKLVIAGPGDDLEHYQEQAAQTTCADRIIFTGFVDHHKLGSLYGAANVFAFPSVTDTQGMTVNEAACAGLPIVMVDREISEVMASGQNGYFARNAPRDFAAKLIAVLTNDKLHKRFSERSVELAAEVSASQQAAKLLRLYQETIERHHEAATETQESPSDHRSS